MTKATSTSITCSACGASASGKFCNNCGAALSPGTCRQCGHGLPAGARFCNECGASSAGADIASMGGAASASGAGVAPYLPWGLAGLALVAVAAYFGGQSGGQPATTAIPAEAAAPFAPFANGGANGGAGGAPRTAPDIGSMSPRERASRLYDRIMRYSEQGKKDSAAFFAPMAMASFEMLGADLDLDARYDYGRVAAETDHLDVAAAQADTILLKSPNHLLGLALKARTAASRGDNATASKTWKLFAAAKGAELAKKLPEYELHRSDIESATKLAAGGK